MSKIKIAICSYGKLGKGVENELRKIPDMELVGIFSRRPKKELGTTAEVFSMDDMEKYENDIDVVIMCSGSSNDLENQVPMFAKYYCTIDNYGTHAKIPEYCKKVKNTSNSRYVSIISVGWDPGLFSLNRLYEQAFFVNRETDARHKQLMNSSLNLESNPEFTASVLIAYARAAYQMYRFTYEGVYTIFDVPPAFLLPISREELLTLL